MKRWTKNEDYRLGQLYPDHRAESIATILGRTPAAINRRASYKGIRKSVRFMVQLRRKERGAYREFLITDAVDTAPMPPTQPAQPRGARLSPAALLAHRATLDCMPNPLAFLNR